MALVEHVQLFRVKYSCQKKWHTELPVKLRMYPNRQLLAHSVVHMPLCPHVLFCVAGLLHSNWVGRGNRHLGDVPPGVLGYRCPQAIAMLGGGGVGFEVSRKWLAILTKDIWSWCIIKMVCGPPIIDAPWTPSPLVSPISIHPAISGSPS